MEAGGFEPPSRDISKQASTCLVTFLNFASLTAKQQAVKSASPIVSYQLGSNIQAGQPAM